MDDQTKELKKRIRAAFKAYRAAANEEEALQIEARYFHSEGELDCYREGISDGLGYELEEYEAHLEDPQVEHLEVWVQKEIRSRKKARDLKRQQAGLPDNSDGDHIYVNEYQY